MEQAEWIVRFCWVKSHARTLGNELADRLAKEAAKKTDISICYNEISKCVVQSEIKKKTSVEKWQSIWSSTTKGKITKEYFPKIAESLNKKITTNQQLTTMVTGHGNTKPYLYRFKPITSPSCPCGKNDQTTDHLLYECDLLKTQRQSLKSTIAKSEVWPTSKNILISKHYKLFKSFVNSIPFDNLG